MPTMQFLFAERPSGWSNRAGRIGLVATGWSQQAVRQQFGVGHVLLLAWLQRYGTAAYAQMYRKQFTDAQNHHIIS